MRRDRIVSALPVVVAVLAVAAGAVPRIALAADALPAPLRPFVWSDVLHIWERGARGVALPYWNVFFEYPPLIGYLWAAIERVGPSAVATVTLWAVVQALAAGIVAFLLTREAGAARTLLFWSLSPQLLLYGSLNFDLLAVAALVAAVSLARRERLVGSAVALAVGAAAKLFPIVGLPVILTRRAVARDALPVVVATAAFLVVTAVAFAPGALAPYPTLFSIGRYSTGIAPNLDSVWGLVRAVVLATGWDPVDWIVTLSLAGTAVTYLVLVLPSAARSEDPAAPMALAVLTVLLWTRLYSPQYSLWVLPFFALLGLRGRTYALLAIADVGVFLTVYPLTLVRWQAGDPFGTALAAALVVAVILREIALIVASVGARSTSRPIRRGYAARGTALAGPDATSR